MFFGDLDLGAAFVPRMTLSIEGTGEEAGGGGDPGDENDAPAFDVMDHEQRTAKAAELLSEPGEAAAAGKEEGQEAAATEEGAEDKEELTDEQRQQQEQEAKLSELRALPEFKELETFKTEVQEVLDTYNVGDTKELKLQLDDSHVLYQIMQGQESVSKLLDLALSNPDWSNEQKQALGAGLVQWLKANKFLGEGAAAGGAKKEGDKAGFKDPVEERLDALEAERKKEREGQEAEKHRANQEKIFNQFTGAIDAEMKALKIPVDKEELGRYISQVTRKMQADKAAYQGIYNRIVKGNYVDVKRFVAEVHAAELARLQKYTQNVAKNATDKNKRNPHIAGGAPPAPAGSAKAKGPMKRDDRIAAGVAALSE